MKPPRKQIIESKARKDLSTTMETAAEKDRETAFDLDKPNIPSDELINDNHPKSETTDENVETNVKASSLTSAQPPQEACLQIVKTATEDTTNSDESSPSAYSTNNIHDKDNNNNEKDNSSERKRRSVNPTTNPFQKNRGGNNTADDDELYDDIDIIDASSNDDEDNYFNNNNNNNNNDFYCAYAARNQDSDGRILTVDNSKTPFCKIPPPGADAFSAWFADGTFHDLIQQKDDDVFPLEGSDDSGDDSDDNNSDENNNNNNNNNNNIASLEEQRLREDPVRRFMGPLDHTLARQFRRTRRKKIEYDHGFRNAEATSFGSVSYKILDTPVWHNYTMEIQRGQGKEKKGSSAAATTTTTTTNFGSVSQPDMAATRKQLRQRPVIGFLQCIFSCPRSRTKRGPDFPIPTYLQDQQFLIRIVLICIGVIVSLLSKGVEEANERLLNWKLDFVASSGYTSSFAMMADYNTSTPMTDDEILSSEGPSYEASTFVPGFGAFLGFNLIFMLLAFLPVAFRPVAAGSGIAEAKAVLNGIILPRSTDLLTALCKATSVIFSAAASLPVGLEGPLIFMGMALGENAQRFLPDAYAGLKTDQLKRDFATVGTACGVTGAFLSPIGGVLFAMEEGASFWTTKLAWRSFSAACVTAICMYTWSLLIDKDWHFSIYDMAIYSGLNGETIVSFPTWSIWDYFGFAVMGVIGGVLGAVWIQANYYLSILRNKVPLRMKRRFKIAELLVLVGLVSVVLWYLPLAYTVCSDVADTMAEDKSVFRQMNCPEGQYNHLATLFLNPVGSVGINLLYWEPDHVFHPTCCLIAGVVHFVLLLLLFGTSISMGIFIPLLYIGACFGRAGGIWLYMGSGCTRTYAIVFSVAMLAGVVRVLISISAIIMCTTALTYMVTPFMVATIFARVCGKAVFGKEGIYDVILELKGIPFLDSEPPKAIRLRGLRAQDVMSRSPLVTLDPEPTVERVMEVLEKYPMFPDYPIVDPTRGGIFMGVITRQDLLTIMKHRALFIPRDDLLQAAPLQSSTEKILRPRRQRRLALRFEELTHQRYRSVPTIQSVQEIVTDADRKFCVVDLTPYLEIGHYTVNRLVSIERTFELFRTLGLRDLIVTDPVGRPVGVITRYDLKLLEEVGVDELELSRKRSNIGTYAVS